MRILRSVILIAIVCGGWISAGCASNHAGQASAGMPVNKYCAINTKEEVDPKVTYMYQGKTIGFCCSDCINDFKKDPEKYMKDLK